MIKIKTKTDDKQYLVYDGDQIVGHFVYMRTRTYQRAAGGGRTSFVNTWGELHDHKTGTIVRLGCYSNLNEARRYAREYFEFKKSEAARKKTIDFPERPL